MDMGMGMGGMGGGMDPTMMMSSSSMMCLCVIGAAAGYYFLVYKPKEEAKAAAIAAAQEALDAAIAAEEAAPSAAPGVYVPSGLGATGDAFPSDDNDEDAPAPPPVSPGAVIVPSPVVTPAQTPAQTPQTPQTSPAATPASNVTTTTINNSTVTTTTINNVTYIIAKDGKLIRATPAQLKVILAAQKTAKKTQRGPKPAKPTKPTKPDNAGWGTSQTFKPSKYWLTQGSNALVSSGCANLTVSKWSKGAKGEQAWQISPSGKGPDGRRTYTIKSTHCNKAITASAGCTAAVLAPLSASNKSQQWYPTKNGNGNTRFQNVACPAKDILPLAFNARPYTN
jgi:hypothetical protein